MDTAIYSDEAIVKPIERAVKGDRVTGLAAVLGQMHAEGSFAKPGVFAEARSDRYARKLIWRDPEDRFIIVGLTWSPGQSSPLHDHDGLWGAEIVVTGTMRETPFRLIDQDATRGFQFEAKPSRAIQAGEVGILIPPLEYHDFGNAGSTIAHTISVYGGNLHMSHAFSPSGDGWWAARSVALAYDA